jgi:hypothetical protein
MKNYYYSTKFISNYNNNFDMSKKGGLFLIFKNYEKLIKKQYHISKYYSMNN